VVRIDDNESLLLFRYVVKQSVYNVEANHLVRFGATVVGHFTVDNHQVKPLGGPTEVLKVGGVVVCANLAQHIRAHLYSDLHSNTHDLIFCYSLIIKNRNLSHL
jgi:hypothetical protein